MGRTSGVCAVILSAGLVAFAQTPPAGSQTTPPAPAGPAPGTVQGTPAQDTARGATILADARKAIGGEDRLKAVQRIEVKGKSARAASAQSNIEGDFEIQIELPDKFRRREALTMGAQVGFDVVQILNGATATQRAEAANTGGAIGGFDGGGDGGNRGGGRGGRGFNPAQLLGNGDANQEEAIKRALTTDMARMLRSLLLVTNEQVAWVGVAESPDGKADVLEFKTPDGVATRLMVDEKTRMPLMMSWTGTPSGLSAIAGRGNRGGNQGQQGRRGGGPAGQGGPAPLQMYFSDYKTVNNIKLPHLIQSGANGETTEELVVKSYRINPSFRAEIFQK
jgi:hypothetical protein